MLTKRPRTDCLLSIDPSFKGFGFAVFHGPELLVDWGVARVWGKTDDEFVARVDAMLDRYRPTVVVLEGGSARRSERTKRRLRLIGKLVAHQGISIARVSPSAVREAFGELFSSTKYDVALAIARTFPELEMHLPPRRTAWVGEDERINLFDAVALAVAATQAGGLQPSRSA